MAKSFLRRSSRKRQQGDIPSLLDRRRQTVLMRCADTSQAPRHNLSALRDKLPQQTVVLVVNVFDLLDAELAYFLAPEELAAASAAFAGPPGPRPGPPNRGRSPPGRGPCGRSPDGACCY